MDGADGCGISIGDQSFSDRSRRFVHAKSDAPPPGGSAVGQIRLRQIGAGCGSTRLVRGSRVLRRTEAAHALKSLGAGSRPARPHMLSAAALSGLALTPLPRASAEELVRFDSAAPRLHRADGPSAAAQVRATRPFRAT